MVKQRTVEPARLKMLISVFIVSPLEIRQYIGVTKLQKTKNFPIFKVEEFLPFIFLRGEA